MLFQPHPLSDFLHFSLMISRLTQCSVGRCLFSTLQSSNDRLCLLEENLAREKVIQTVCTAHIIVTDKSLFTLDPTLSIYCIVYRSLVHVRSLLLFFEYKKSTGILDLRTFDCLYNFTLLLSC